MNWPNRLSIPRAALGATLAVLGAWFAPAAPRGVSGHQSPPTPAKDAGAWFEKGAAALRAGDLAAAESDFHRVLALDPNSGAAYVNLGVIAMRRKDWNEALKNLNKAEKLAPKMTGIRLNIGLVYFHQEKYAEAIAPLQSVLRDQPDSQQARYLLGLCQLFTSQFAASAHTLTPLWDHMSDQVMYLYVVSIAAHEAGQKELDEKALKQLLTVGGNTPELHMILGKAHYQHQEYDPALAEFQEAREANPELPLLHFNLGITYKQLERDGEAEGEFLKDIAIDPDVPDNYYQLGLLYSRQQKDDDAEKAFQEALKRDPRRSGAWFGLAKIYERQQKYADALHAVDEAVRLAPDSRLVHFLRGQILQHLGRKDEAKAEFLMAKKLMDQGLKEDREKMEQLSTTNPELKQVPE
jgi:tetratricopeptide (TPR) repeat protein